MLNDAIIKKPSSMTDPAWPNLKRQSAKKLTESLHVMMVKALGAKVKTFQTASGPIVYLETPPRENREVILFLHGFCDNKYSFFKAAFALSKHYQVIVPDLPGFGESFHKEGISYNVNQYVGWIVDFIDHLNFGKVHLVGNSLGGAFSIAIAEAAPERLHSLGIVNAAGVLVDGIPSFYTDLSAGKNIFQIHNWQEYEFFLKRIFFRIPYIPWAKKTHLYYELMEYREWHDFLLAELVEGVTDVKDQAVHSKVLNQKLEQIKAPTLIVWGKQDAFFPYQTAHYIHHKIAGSRLKIFENMGHSPQIEDPKKFVKSYLGFLGALKNP